MIPKELKDIEQADIEALVGEVHEGRTIDFKADLPGASDADKREFLADVSSMANTAGGDLVFGVREEAGWAAAVVGVRAIDVDAEVLRLDSVIRSGIDPRIRHDVRRVKCGADRTVLVLRVERSWLAPHRVTFKGHDRFYARSSAGKYSLDVMELRQAFLRSTSAVDQIRTFRERRLVDIAADRTPLPLPPGARVVLHVVPLEAFTLARQVDLAPLYDTPNRLPPMGHSGWGHRITIDGLLTFSLSGNAATAYAHLFRSAVLEAVTSLPASSLPSGPEKYLASILFERMILQGLRPFLAAQSSLGVAPPVYVFLSLVGVKGYRMATRSSWEVSEVIDREVLVMPEAVVADYAASIPATMKGPIDLVWNACGFRCSPNFDGDGNWVPSQ